MRIARTGHFDGSWEKAVALSDAERNWVVLVQHSRGRERLHQHPVSQIVYMLKGGLTFFSGPDEAPVRVTPGDIAQIPANLAHRVDIRPRTVYLMRLGPDVSLGGPFTAWLEPKSPRAATGSRTHRAPSGGRRAASRVGSRPR